MKDALGEYVKVIVAMFMVLFMICGAWSILRFFIF